MSEKCCECGADRFRDIEPEGTRRELAHETDGMDCLRRQLATITAIAKELAEELVEQEALACDDEGNYYWPGNGERIGLKE